jgi:CheY-like chemotaxis protein
VIRRSKTVLIVDDDSDICAAISTVLMDEGYDVACVGDGRAGLAYLDERIMPDLILLDLMMPVMNGWLFKARQRQHRMGADIPVVIMTASTACGDVKTGSLGARECIVKPFSRSTLLAAIKRNVPALDG